MYDMFCAPTCAHVRAQNPFNVLSYKFKTAKNTPNDVQRSSGQLVIYSLNQLYTGSARPAPGPPTEAQEKSIGLLLEDCGELC